MIRKKYILFLLSFFGYYFCNITTTTSITNKPLAIVHIGPHKTGTTHFQSVIIKYHELIESNGYHVAFKKFKGGSLDFALRLDNITVVNEYKSFFSSLAYNKTNLLLSGEELSSLSLKKVRIVYDILKKFDVRIVFVYRDLMSKLLSQYINEVGLLFVNFGREIYPNFSQYLQSNCHSSSRGLLVRILKKYSIVFGKKNLIGVSYNGVIAAGKDIAYVILCDIMHLFCNNNKLLMEIKSFNRSNSESDHPPLGINYILIIINYNYYNKL